VPDNPAVDFFEAVFAALSETASPLKMRQVLTDQMLQHIRTTTSMKRIP
jgi:hypothetical protein